MNGSAVFAYINDQIETPLLDNLNQLVLALVAYASTPVQTSVVIYIALTGVLMLRGYANETFGNLFSRLIKISIITWVSTNGAVYTYWVSNFFLTALPTDINHAVATAMNATDAISANSFDIVLQKAFDAGLQVWKLLKWYQIGEQMFIILFVLVAIVSCIVTFAIWFISHISLAIFIAIGPLMLGLVLFPVTKPIFERWIGAMISCVIVQVTTVILLTLTLQVEGQLVTELATYKGNNPFEQDRILIAAMGFFGFVTILAFQIPGYGTALAGGLHFHAGAVGRAAMSIATGGASTLKNAAGKVGPVANATVGAGARAAYRRIRPQTGGSLSRASKPSA